MSKISRKNHADSLDKWGGNIILHKLKNKIPFDYLGGWDDLEIESWCGYCKERSEQGIDCIDCNLSSSNGGCNQDYYDFLNEMGENNPNFKKAEKHRKALYNKILADEPNVYEGK